MPPSSQVTAEGLLNGLLDRHESPAERVRDITQPIDYTRVGGPAAQDELHRVLAEAQRVGAVKLERDRLGRFTDEFARVRLVDPGSLYRFLARTPSTVTADAAMASVKEALPEISDRASLQGVLDDASAAWRVNKRFLGFGPDKANTFVTALRLAYGILNYRGNDIDHRTFSRKMVKDSKALERLEQPVTKLLQRLDETIVGDEPRDILRTCGIVRRAHPLFVKGPLSIDCDGFSLRGSGPLFIGLPYETVLLVTLSQPIDYAITIENPTSFWRYCSEIDGRYLAMLTDGFPARDVLAGMTHLVRAARASENVPVFHWGDIDAGGVQIAAHLEDSFGFSLDLHDMRPDLAYTHGTPLKSSRGLDRLAARSGPIGDLARWLTTAGAMVLEQEELPPRAPAL